MAAGSLCINTGKGKKERRVREGRKVMETGMRQSTGWSHQQCPFVVCEYKQKRDVRDSRGARC
jgi:hypothetical protein